jgi:hypothetical protein
MNVHALPQVRIRRMSESQPWSMLWRRKEIFKTTSVKDIETIAPRVATPLQERSPLHITL